MCGIFGVVAARGRTPSISATQADRLRDMLAHRGPDGAGTWSHENAIIAHRRLAVLDPSPAGAQPMRTPDGRYVLSYNGELYNDLELRRDLRERGVRFVSDCDAETVLHALAQWGRGALARFRGMYALAFYDAREHTLLLARDPLGVKPLYLHAGAHELVFASEPAPIVAHPGVGARPNIAMISAYLTTIRTVLGNDTLFEGVHALAPGQGALVRFERGVEIETFDHWAGPATRDDGADEVATAALVRRAVEESVRLHLRADVPTCALLSGGLDSAVVASIACGAVRGLRTYCAGACSPNDDEIDDLACARLMASTLRTRHSEAIITESSFAHDWAWMVERMGVPLSTPNEVAIHAVSSRLRADGCVVTISGEGADELFAGYEAPMRSALEHVQRAAAGGGVRGGRFELDANAWIPSGVKPALLRPEVWRAIDGDASLVRTYDDIYAACAHEAAGSGRGVAPDTLDAHLRFHRRVNLAGLLQRLDTATMLAGVEGRTPFADARFAELAESLPMRVKFELAAAGVVVGEEHGAAARTRGTLEHGVTALARGRPEHGAGGTLEIGEAAPACRTKIALREAFRDALPREIVERPKASFPLPFQGWMAAHAPALSRSALSQEVFTPEMIERVQAEPSTHWRFAWPMINIAMWGERWWG
ncbi:MAG: asparagine synthase (glutamine-hydrolyzing) [Phycisphaerales bacterium]|nr:MAG: asparagine synthase (glutamine-hydrolyzing) [Phycisphaerales bacterium]